MSGDRQLDELIAAARAHGPMTEAERRTQRESWVRGEMGMGDEGTRVIKPALPSVSPAEGLTPEGLVETLRANADNKEAMMNGVLQHTAAMYSVPEQIALDRQAADRIAAARDRLHCIMDLTGKHDHPAMDPVSCVRELVAERDAAIQRASEAEGWRDSAIKSRDNEFPRLRLKNDTLHYALVTVANLATGEAQRVALKALREVDEADEAAAEARAARFTNPKVSQ